MWIFLLATSFTFSFLSILHADPLDNTKLSNASDTTPPLQRTAQNRLDFQSYDNYDLNGTELSVLKEVPLQTCFGACRSDSRCQAFTFDKWKRQCSLKTNIISTRFDPISIAGILAGASLPPEANMPWKMQRLPGTRLTSDAYESRGNALLRAVRAHLRK